MVRCLPLREEDIIGCLVIILPFRAHAQLGTTRHSKFVDTPENAGIIKVQQTEVSFGHHFKRKSSERNFSTDPF